MDLYENSYMDIDKMYNNDLKIKYLINNESYLVNDISENFSNIQSSIDTQYVSKLIEIGDDICNNLRTLLKNEFEYEKYTYKKYKEYYSTLKISENTFDTILNNGDIYGIYGNR